MNKKIFGSFIVAIVIFASIALLFFQEDTIKYRSTEEIIPKTKQGKITFNFTISTNETTNKLRLWVPYPVSNENQKIENVIIDGSFNYSGIHREAESDTMILYAEWEEPKDDAKIIFSFNVTRNEIIMKNFPGAEGLLPVDVEKFLLPTNLGPTTGKVKDFAMNIVKGKTTILTKATAIYDYLVEYGERDPTLNNCGTGDVCTLLDNLTGKCADFSSVFVALCRSVGIPAREIFGIRMASEGDITGAYHCHAEFYLPTYGWVPVDPSDVRKLMLKQDLGLNDPKVEEARDYYFETQTETYIDLSKGRDVTLNPEQEGEKLNYFMYPYAEIDGKPLDYISQETLKYIVTFEEI